MPSKAPSPWQRSQGCTSTSPRPCSWLPSHHPPTSTAQTPSLSRSHLSTLCMSDSLNCVPQAPYPPHLSPRPAAHSAPSSGQSLNPIKSVFWVQLTFFPPFHHHNGSLHCGPHDSPGSLPGSPPTSVSPSSPLHMTPKGIRQPHKSEHASPLLQTIERASIPCRMNHKVCSSYWPRGLVSPTPHMCSVLQLCQKNPSPLSGLCLFTRPGFSPRFTSTWKMATFPARHSLSILGSFLIPSTLHISSLRPPQ